MDTRVIGRPLHRYEGRLKVTGAARFASDHVTRSCVHLYGIRSPLASGRVVAVDVEAALRAPGVIDVIHVCDAPRFFRVDEATQVGERRTPFEDQTLYYAGQLVAVVVAESFAQARWAARLVRVKYRAGEAPVLDLESGLRQQAASDRASKRRGDPEDAYADAAVRIDATYCTPVETHSAMELHSTLAEWISGKLVVEDSTQWVVGQAEALAQTFGLPKADVEVRSRFIGGGFGGKLFLWPHTILAAEAARRSDRPALFVLDRSAEFSTAGHRPLTSQRLRIGADRQGRFQSILHDAISHTSLVHDYEEACSDVTRSLYSCRHVSTTQRTVELNTGSPTPMRGPGEVPGLWALESAIDELAWKLQVDPLELRLANLASEDQDKGLPWSSHHHERCLRQASEIFGWSQRDPNIGSMQDGDELIGWGVASATWSASRSESCAQVDLLADGSARVTCATQDIGTGTYTVIAQVVSELTGLGFERIDARIGSSRYPEGPISGGSMATASVVPAVVEATEKAITKLLELAARPGGPFHGYNSDSIRLQHGQVTASDGSRSASIVDILGAAGLAYVGAEASASPGKERDSYSFRSFGAHCVEIRWDPGLARLRVSRVVSVIDAGRIINEKTAANQIYGAIMMGIGMALMEETVYDRRDGRVVNDNLADYHIPVNADTPQMTLNLLNEPDPHIGQLGARGIGEIGLTGIASAIASAIFHATGIRLRHLPMRASDLLLP